MLLKRKPIVISLALIFICVIATISFQLPLSKATSANIDSRPQIILDAGHGGFDGGAVAQDGTVEKDINLNICITLCQMLRQSGYDVIMTREADVSTDNVETDKIATRKKSDLKTRLELMDDYPDAVFVSVHLNKFTTAAARGSQVFYSSKTKESKILGDKIQASIIGRLQPENTRVNKQATSSTYLLYNATLPAVLVECGFLSNTAELKMLKDTDYQNKMAFSIYCGINEYFSAKKEI